MTCMPTNVKFYNFSEKGENIYIWLNSSIHDAFIQKTKYLKKI